MSMNVYLVLHWDEEGAGTGMTVIVAPDERRARLGIQARFCEKPYGYRQGSASTVEVELYEWSQLASYPFTDLTPGFKSEYRLALHGALEVVALGCDVRALADELQEAQAELNDGLGLTCVRTLIAHLRRGRLTEARQCVWSDGDKMATHEAIVSILKRIGFWFEAGL